MRLFLLFLIAFKLFAIEQMPEILYYDGERYLMDSTPLEDYWRADKKPEAIKITTPKLLRGYQGEWIIQENQLYLIGCYWEYQGYLFLRRDRDNEEMPRFQYEMVAYSMRDLFGDDTLDGAFYTGQLNITREIDGVHMILYVKKGKMIKVEELWDDDVERYSSIDDLYRTGNRLQSNTFYPWIDGRLFQSDYMKQFEKKGDIIHLRGMLQPRWLTPGKIVVSLPETPKTEAVRFIFSAEHLPVKTGWFFSPKRAVFTLRYAANGWQLIDIDQLNSGEGLFHGDYRKIVAEETERAESAEKHTGFSVEAD